MLCDLFVDRGVPEHIRSDNGPEFGAQAIRRFLAGAGVEILYIDPGSPWQNDDAESFNSRLRDELLNVAVFENVAERQFLAIEWLNAYHYHRRHSSLGYQIPAEYAADCATSAPAAPALQPHS